MEYKFFKNKKNGCVYASTEKQFVNCRSWIINKNNFHLKMFHCQVMVNEEGVCKSCTDIIDKADMIEITYKEFEYYINKIIQSMLKKYKSAYKRNYGTFEVEDIENKRIPNAPQDESYKYYRIEYESKEYYCYVQKYNDIMLNEKKEVGFLSVGVDGFEKGGVLPFPSVAYRIDEDDDDILHSFIREYTKEVGEDDYEDAISSYYSEFDY